MICTFDQQSRLGQDSPVLVSSSCVVLLSCFIRSFTSYFTSLSRRYTCKPQASPYFARKFGVRCDCQQKCAHTRSVYRNARAVDEVAKAHALSPAFTIECVLNDDVVQVGFSRLAKRMTMARTLKLHRLPERTNSASKYVLQDGI